MSRSWLTIIATLTPRQRELLRDEQSVMDLDRMEPRDHLGMSSWISCSDPFCRVTSGVIVAQTPHMHDPISNTSLHIACYDRRRQQEAMAEGSGGDVTRTVGAVLDHSGRVGDITAGTSLQDRIRDAMDSH